MAAHRLIVLVLVAAIPLLTHAAAGSGSNGEDQIGWEILTSKNFSSQIRLHPHVLLLVTVSWCGESRSLMREISHKLKKEHDQYGSLKLMVVHRNIDKVLATSVDAGQGITVLCYHLAVSYRYHGSLRAQAILSSVHYLTSSAPNELPLKRLNNSEELDMFLASTDKAILLLESCGWTSKLLMQHYGNETLQGGVLAERLNKETNRTLASGGQKNLKGMGNEMISDEADDRCGRSPWVEEFSAQNETASLTDEDIHTTFEMSCSFEEFKKFESFFIKFLAVVRDFYLPSQRQRYGLVSERLLLSPLGVEVSDQWYLIVSYAGCPGCLKVLKEGDHLHDVIERHDLPVMELADKGGDIGPSLPINKPSLLLFVDRTSDSIETRRRSWEALHAFKEVALQYWKPKQVDGKNIDWPKRSPLQTHEGSINMFGSQRLLLSHSSQKIKLNDKMSIMIINEGEQVTLDSEATNLESKSLHEILTYLVGQKKQSKLSSLAKEAGFQLLSDDIDIKAADVPSSQTESDNQDSTRNPIEVSDKDLLHMNKETDKISTVEQGGEESQPLSAEALSAGTEQKTPDDLGSEESALSDPHQSLDTDEIASPIYLDSKVQSYVLFEKSANAKHQSGGFTGSFLFSECDYQFLRSLTNSSKIPRIVIIDPISQQHHVLSEIANLSSNSVSTFIDEFLNGSLIPYQRSGPLWNSIEMPHPPFVNLDFHEKDPIPSVTVEMFSELVFGVGQPDGQNATNPWHRDVLVLFSSSWCGFCQRMELVVREVYRALKGYMDMVNSDSMNKEKVWREDLKDNALRVPAIYSIDCTLNECGSILRSMGQRDVYPTLLLFPAESKTPIPYDGNMMVTDVIRFIANHGHSSHHLSRERGTLWVDEEERDNHDDQHKGESMSRGRKDPLHGKDGYFGAVDRNGESTTDRTSKPNAAPQEIAVGSFLIATDHLHGLNLFSEAKILIVGADYDIGFRGVIVNKPVGWDSIKFEDANLAELLKEAPLSFGGPVIQEGLPFVSLTRSSLNDQYPQVLSGVYFLDPLATIHEIEKIKAGNQSATNYWFFWGYSGWGWDQLFSEIAGAAWSVHEGKPEDLQWP